MENIVGIDIFLGIISTITMAWVGAISRTMSEQRNHMLSMEREISKMRLEIEREHPTVSDVDSALARIGKVLDRLESRMDRLESRMAEIHHNSIDAYKK